MKYDVYRGLDYGIRMNVASFDPCLLIEVKFEANGTEYEASRPVPNGTSDAALREILRDMHETAATEKLFILKHGRQATGDELIAALDSRGAQ